MVKADITDSGITIISFCVKLYCMIRIHRLRHLIQQFKHSFCRCKC